MHGDERLELQIVKPCGSGAGPAPVSNTSTDGDLVIAAGIEQDAGLDPIPSPKNTRCMCCRCRIETDWHLRQMNRAQSVFHCDRMYERLIT